MFYLLVWMESQGSWHEVDSCRAPSLRHATSVLRNTHPRLRGIWAVVPESDLQEALESVPHGISVRESEALYGG
jgi:hypothetical protein